MTIGGRLHRLHAEHGQSPWLDSLTRTAIADGSLDRHVARGVRGVTTNPTIFHAAIAGSASYDESIERATRDGASPEDVCWSLICSDVEAAAGCLRGVHEASGGEDGWVSIEVSPELAHDSDATVAAAVALRRRLPQANVMIKIPATLAGLAAITECAELGISVNATLIFGIERYRRVREAWWDGLERLAARNPGSLRTMRGVASFFVSRVDAFVDARLPDDSPVRARTAINQSRLAYLDHVEATRSERWSRLADLGAHPQRILWASTGTKDPSAPDTRYVDELIGPDTVTTLPIATLEAFDDHGTLTRTVDADLDRVRAEWEALRTTGIDMAEVSRMLESAGVESFRESHRALVSVVAERASSRTA